MDLVIIADLFCSGVGKLTLSGKALVEEIEICVWKALELMIYKTSMIVVHDESPCSPALPRLRAVEMKTTDTSI